MLQHIKSEKNYFILRTILYPIAEIKIDINGDIKLKKQYGKYSIVETLRTVACVIPHEFHGIMLFVVVSQPCHTVFGREINLS